MTARLTARAETSTFRVEVLAGAALSVLVYYSILGASLRVGTSPTVLVLTVLGGTGLGIVVTYVQELRSFPGWFEFLVFAVTLGAGLVAFPSGLPEHAWLGVLALVWGALASKAALVQLSSRSSRG